MNFNIYLYAFVVKMVRSLVNFSFSVYIFWKVFIKGIYFGQKSLFKPPTLLRFLICPPFFHDFLRFLLRKTHFIKKNPYLPPVFFKNPGGGEYGQNIYPWYSLNHRSESYLFKLFKVFLMQKRDIQSAREEMFLIILLSWWFNWVYDSIEINWIK